MRRNGLSDRRRREGYEPPDKFGNWLLALVILALAVSAVIAILGRNN